MRFIIEYQPRTSRFISNSRQLFYENTMPLRRNLSSQITPPPPPATSNKSHNRPPPPATSNTNKSHNSVVHRNQSRNAPIHADPPGESVLTLKFEVPACSSGHGSPVLRQRGAPQPYFHDDIMGWETELESDDRMTSGIRPSPTYTQQDSGSSRFKSGFGPSATSRSQMQSSKMGFGRQPTNSLNPDSATPYSRTQTGSSSLDPNSPFSGETDGYIETEGSPIYTSEGYRSLSLPDTFEGAISPAKDKEGNECALCEGEDGDVYVCKRRYAKKEEPKPMRFAECYENKFKELDSVRCEYEKQLWCLQKQLDKERRCTMEEFSSMQKEYCQYDKALEMYALRVAMDQIAISKANLEHEYADQIHTGCPDTDSQHPCCPTSICPLPPNPQNCCSRTGCNPPNPCQTPSCPTPCCPTPCGPTPCCPTPCGPTPCGPTPCGPTPCGPTPCGPTACCPTPCCPTPACAPALECCEEEPALQISHRQLTVACSVCAVIAFVMVVRFFCFFKNLLLGCGPGGCDR